jgi:tRNA pseudouridine55 synthase
MNDAKTPSEEERKEQELGPDTPDPAKSNELDINTPAPATIPMDEDVPEWIKRLDRDRESIIPLVPAKSAPVEIKVAEPVKSGILIVDKPAGQTSHDVVQAVRKAAGIRRVGHAGTLDPMATGVLVVCLGSATRVIEEIQEGEKGYRARVRLGETTDTYDAEGEIQEKIDPAEVTEAALLEALEDYRGDILQVPPMYSALKHEGRRLYDLAREGIEVERPARPVRVYAMDLVDWSPPEFTLEMRVSKGTYVRSIAHDLGQQLGVGGHLVALRRSYVGPFVEAEAERLPRIVEAFVENWWPALMHPLDAALVHLSAMVVDEEREKALRNGQQIEAQPPIEDPNARVRAYSDAGGFIGLLRWDDVHERWQPDRIFPKPER